MTRYALKDTQLASIYALAFLAEFRDQVTGKHILHMVKYVAMFCEILKKSVAYANILTEGVGSHFDPVLSRVFIVNHQQFYVIQLINRSSMVSLF